MSRHPIIAVALGLLLLSAGSWVWSAEPQSQKGLPPELTIADQPELPTQLTTLLALRQAAAASAPKGGGFGASLKGLFGGAPKSLSVPIDQIVPNLEALRSKIVSVSGVYQTRAADAGVLPYEGGALLISLPASVVREGFSQTSLDGLPVTIEGVVEQDRSGKAQVRATKVTLCDWLAALRIARLQERLGHYAQAEKSYNDATPLCQKVKSPFAAFAKVSAGRVAYSDLRDIKKARNQFSMAWNPYTQRDRAGKPANYTWMPRQDGSGWDKLGVADAIRGPLDALNSRDFWYKFMAFFVELAGGISWLGILLVAVISRVAIWPLTKKQLVSAQSMQRLQPQIKALQDRYTDDKAKFNEEFWKLCQANGVNPMGGCLPTLVQLPILWALYNGIRGYIVQFDGKSFLWVHNLAGSDMTLLIAYTISMVFYQKMMQKLQPSPTMNAQQQQQQQMMTYMMPVMMFFFFQGFPAAFILYWLATNIVSFIQQYLFTHQSRKLAMVEGGTPPPVKRGGFADAMVRMLSSRGEEPTENEQPQDTRSFHEREAEAKGKKAAKPDEPQPHKRGRK